MERSYGVSDSSNENEMLKAHVLGGYIEESRRNEDLLQDVIADNEVLTPKFARTNLIYLANVFPSLWKTS